jgi:myo-inositol-1(or 4)-monophosphatase
VTDWLAFCRDAAAAVERALAELSTRTDREPVVALGEGGDETTAVDAAAESAVVSLLERLHAGGVEFTLVSEELGERSFGADGVRVVLDPIDGSMNAKRGIPFFSVSIAVADGAVMRDVFFGYVFDFGTREEWTARRGEGAFLNGERLDGPGPKEEVEMLSFEATTTELVAEQIADMVGIADRTRIMGSLALSLCHLAAGRVDGVCSLKPARSVDIAAAQLLVRERGLAIDLPDAPPFGEAPLDLAGRSRVVAAASPERCAELFARLSASDRSDAAGSPSRPATRPP